MFRSPFVALAVIFVVCAFCGKDFISLGRHSWRCKSKLNSENDFTRVNTSPLNLFSPDSMPVITNGNKEVKCTCGKHCKGLKGLKAHQRSCRIILGLHENLRNDLDEENYDDIDENTFGDTNDSNCTLTPIICIGNSTESMKNGVKLPKSTHQWSIANDFFKAAFLNRPISSAGLNDVIKEFNVVIYNYFKDTCGSVDSNYNTNLSAKYKDKSAKDLKRILKVLKRSGDDIEEIKFVSRKLRLTLRNGNIGDVKTTNINFDHDSLISKSFWGYVKRFLTSKDKKLPSFTEADCISFFRNVFTSMNPNKIFRIPSWIPLFAPPQIPFNLDPPSYQQVTNVIRNMKASGSPCPLDQISVIAFKRCPYLRTYLTDIIRSVWSSGEVPSEWKKACTILVHKKGDTADPANFRPITLESVPLKIFTSCLRNSLYQFLLENNYIESKIQKGFTPKISGTLEHTSQMANAINKARIKQRSLIITLLDLKNAFGEVHHNLIFEVLRYHHIPNQISNLIRNLYTDFHTSIITSNFNSPFLIVGRGVLQGDCLSPLLFNLCLNTFIQHIKVEKYSQFGFSTSHGPGSSFVPIHWFQFADDAAVISGQEQENQILLNRFHIWCKWAGMLIRVDKCVTFGIKKSSTKSTQFQPKLIIEGNLIPAVKTGDSFRYLGRHFDFNMSNNIHKSELSEITTLVSLIDGPPRLLILE